MEINPNFSKRALEDYELVLRVQEGDEKAFAALLRHYRDSVYFMLYKMVNNQADAEDLTIEIFVKVYQNIDKYSPCHAFSTWLFKITSNHCIDFIRRKKEHARIVEANQDDRWEDGNYRYIQVETPDLNPEGLLINKQKANTIRAIVKELKPKYSRLIELRFFEERSYEEIAKIMDMPIGTVKAQLFRAKELLHDILRDKKQSI
ncbi:MAG TPA: sigma-70 family RNA polymerase sigma factor [Salinivirgaceae bacterium]|nr:sigma-70 family RNA polymerase sigma factor [Salinivirgaceae bacterium]HQA76397.1 sigma-70 family RNA polymerase sigma factor [Salinivirgaceae bacterium]